MRNGTVQRGYVGLGLRTFSADQWEAYGVARDFEGAYVESVTAGGPADRAGAKVGDLLVGVNGEPVEDGTEATRRVGAARPGETIRLEVIRDGRRTTLNVRSGTRPSESELRAADEPGDGPTAPGEAPAVRGELVEGLTVAPLTPALRTRYSLPESVEGLVITEVARSTPASKLGLQAGLVITQADRARVRTVADLRTAIEAVKRSGRPSVLIFVRTPQGTAPVALPFEAAE